MDQLFPELLEVQVQAGYLRSRLKEFLGPRNLKLGDIIQGCKEEPDHAPLSTVIRAAQLIQKIRK